MRVWDVLGGRLARRAGAAVFVMAVLASACSYSGPPAATMRSWMSQNSFIANERQVLADLRSLALAVSRGSAKQLRTVCGGLSSDAGTLYGTLPTPDHVVSGELGASMNDLFNGAERCAVAPSARTPSARRGFADIGSGLAELRRARASLRRLGITSPPVPKVTVA